VKTERFIPGIYNYCDYWCERCAFTQRCRNYSMGQEMEEKAEGKPPVDDAVNADFWNRLAGKLRDERIGGRAAEWETDDFPEECDGPDPEWQAREAALDKTVREHPLLVAADEYMKKSHAWLKAAEGDLQAVARRLIEEARNRFSDEDLEEQARQIGEMIEVVSWYHTLIAPKLSRAVRGLREKENVKGPYAALLERTRQQDANGSGKVVLIAVERSIAAWLQLREVLPRQEDAILGMLVLLNRIRHGIRAVFPGAEAFQRPGFDGEANFLTDDTESSEEWDEQ